MSKFNMKVTPEIEKLTQICRENDKLDLSLYGKYDVKRGLRDLNGKGVLAGLTQISNVQATKIVDGKEVPVERILKNGTNYVKIRDVAAALGLEVDNQGNVAVLRRKES